MRTLVLPDCCLGSRFYVPGTVTPESLDLSTSSIGQDNASLRGCPVCSGLLSSIPGPFPPVMLAVPLPGGTTRMSAGIARGPSAAELSPVRTTAFTLKACPQGSV